MVFVREMLLRETLPISMSGHVPGQSLRQVGPDAVQLLGSRQGVECQLLHVGFDQPILGRDKIERAGSYSCCIVFLSVKNRSCFH